MAEPHDLNEVEMMGMQQVAMEEQVEEDVKLILDNSANSLEESTPAELMVLDNNILEETLGPSKPVQEQDDKENSSEESKIESASTGTSASSFIFKCVFCERSLSPSDNPKLLECLHNACSSCISSKLEEQQNVNQAGVKDNIECASCSLPCSVDKLLDNQFLLELHNLEDSSSTKSVEVIKCSSCSDDAIAVSFCVDCAEYICDSCVQAHQRLKITKDHTIKPKEEGYTDNQSSSNGLSLVTLHCNVHPHEKLSLFCEHCDRLTCRDCQLLEHRDHKYKFTHEIASDTRVLISAMLKDVTYKRNLLDTAMKVINDRQGLIVEKKQTLVDEITQLVVKLTNTINVRGKQLVSRLNEVCEHKQKTLQEKKVALDQLSKMTDHCIDFTKHAVDHGSDMALLLSKRQLTQHLQRIKCKRADIPNPEIPVRIHLALDKVPDLIKGLSSVISTIGQIVVDGRVYPTPTSSPATSLPPHGSPSPGHTRSPLQESPLNHLMQFQQQNQPPPQQHHQMQPMGFQQSSQGSFQPQQQQQQHHQQQQQQQHQQQQQQHQQQQQQQHRMPPPYTQFQPNVNIIPNLGPKLPPNLSQNLSQMPLSVPISLAQHLQQNLQKLPMARNSMGRNILPLNRNGLNHQQQQVSSSTHPQGLLQDRDNLRGLLQPINTNNAVYVQTGPNQYQAVQAQFAHQYQNRLPTNVVGQQSFKSQGVLRGGAISLTPANQNYRMPLQQQQQQQQQRNLLPNQDLVQSAKWHIPQQQTAIQDPPIGNHLSNITINRAQVIPGINDNFKIMLKSQTVDTKPATVSSTIPKTPSPNHIQGKSDTERNLDKYCQDSVNDLMATIAKLDSNGVQVLAEGRTKTGGSPQVDSSTDDLSGPTRQTKNELGDSGKDDPNEDWCAVCMDGGELVCCDKCPKVFHQFCHIPNLTVEESDTWQCLLCVNFADMPDGERIHNELSRKERKIAERLVLELYCQYDESLAFRELIGPDNIDYHSIIKNPIALDTIRHKVDWSSSDHYTNMEDLIKDVRLMFSNAYAFNEVGTVVYNNAKTLENFFNQQLEKLLPLFCEFVDDDDKIQPPSKRLRRVLQD